MSEMFENIFENSPVAKILVDSSSQIRFVNKQAEELFQYTRSELIDENVSRLVPEEYRDHHPKLVTDYFSSPFQRQMGLGKNLFGVKKDGKRFPIEVGLTPIQTGKDLLVMSSIIDITERIRAEERFKSAFNAAPSGMIMINQRGSIELVNKATEDIFEYERSELIGQPIELLVPDEFQKSHPEFVKSYTQNPEPRAMGVGRELFGKKKSGSLVPVEIGLRPIQFEDEIFVISSVVDITLRRKNEKEIQSKSDEIQEFSYRTSHDLKAPLLTIGGLLDFIVEDARNGDTKEVINSAHRAKNLAEKLSQLVSDILTLTKTDLNTETSTIFDFQDYFEDVLEKFAYLFQENEVTLQSSFTHQKALLTQKTRLTQILDNLISNSAKYSNKEQKNRFVRIETSNDSEKFFLQVTDNGIGIPKEMHKSVFSMFQRFHPNAAEGSGLGLYMIKKHVEKLDAQISFESSENGTTFSIEFFLSPIKK